MITVVLLLGNLEVEGVASTVSDILAHGVKLTRIEKVDSKGTMKEYGGVLVSDTGGKSSIMDSMAVLSHQSSELAKNIGECSRAVVVIGR